MDETKAVPVNRGAILNKVFLTAVLRFLCWMKKKISAPRMDRSKKVKEDLVNEARRKPVKKIQYFFFTKPYNPMLTVSMYKASVYGSRNIIRPGRLKLIMVFLR